MVLSYEIVRVELSTTTPAPGEWVGLKVVFRNTGDEAVNVWYLLYGPGGDVIEKSMVGCYPGDEGFSTSGFYAPTAPGSYTYRVELREVDPSAPDHLGRVLDSAEFTITVQAPSNPRFLIVSVTAPDRVRAGEEFAVQVAVRNDGGPGVATVCIDSKCAQGGLSHGSTETFVIVLTAPSTPGSYSYTVRVLDASTGDLHDTSGFTVEVVPAREPLRVVSIRVVPSRTEIPLGEAVDIRVEATLNRVPDELDEGERVGVDLCVDGEWIDRYWLPVKVGSATVTATLTVTPSTEGSHVIRVCADTAENMPPGPTCT